MPLSTTAKLIFTAVAFAIVLQGITASAGYSHIQKSSAAIEKIRLLYQDDAKIHRLMAESAALRRAWRNVAGTTTAADKAQLQALQDRTANALRQAREFDAYSPNQREFAARLATTVTAGAAAVQQSITDGSETQDLDIKRPTALYQTIAELAERAQHEADVILNQSTGEIQQLHEDAQAEAQSVTTTFLGTIAISAVSLVCALALASRELRRRRAAEARARLSAETMQDLYENAPCGYFSLDAEGRFLRANRSFAQWIGYSESELTSSVNYRDLLHEEDRARFDENYATLIRTGHARAERQLISKSGDPVYVLIDATAVYADKVFTMTRSTATNIEDYKKAQNDLDQFFAIVPDMLCVIDPEWRFRRVNPAWTETLGYTVEELTGHSFLEFLHPEDHTTTSQLMDGRFEGTYRGKTVNRYVRKDGAVVWFEWADAAHNDTLYGAARDITQRRQAESIAVQSTLFDRTVERTLMLFNSSHDAYWVLDDLLAQLVDEHGYIAASAYSFDEWSNALTRHGSSGNEGLFTHVVRLGAGSAMEGFFAAKAPRQFDASQHSLADEFVLFNGPRPAHGAVIVAPIFFQERLFGVLVLITEGERDERVMAFIARLVATLGVGLMHIDQFNDMRVMADELRTRSDEIGKVNDQLVAANKMKSEFLANMSHELRTPLNAIIGFSEILRDGLTGDLAPKQQEYVEDIYQSGTHLLSLINDILDLSKVEAGKMSLDLEPTDVVAVVQGVAGLLRERAVNGQVNLRVHSALPTLVANLDARKLRQIAFNLISNAVKFTPAGGSVALTIELVGAADATSWIDVTVRDTGIGISAPDLARLFQPFVQADSSLSRQYEGTGLGLVMVKRLVELHGGTVTVESTEGQGSTFSVRLPFRAAPEGGRPALFADDGAEFEQVRVSETRRALLVEDDANAAALIRFQLEREGFEVWHSSNAEDALAYLESHRPDVITLDILLPKMDGWVFLEQLKSDFRLRDIPVVVISIVADSERGFSLGATTVLQKPFPREQLATVLANFQISGDGEGASKGTVLVVDDDPKAVELISRFLEKRGYEVHRAFGGQEGINIATRIVPDLVILDLMMPRVTGFDVINTLRANPQTAGISILVLTAKSVSAAESAELNGNIAGLVEKYQFDFGRFLEDVRSAIK